MFFVCFCVGFFIFFLFFVFEREEKGVENVQAQHRN